MRVVAHLFIGLALTLVLGFSYVMWNFNQPPFRLAKLQTLQRGMSQQQVKQILGEPNSVSDGQWAYSRQLSWPIVYIYFDEQGLFKESVYDY